MVLTSSCETITVACFLSLQILNRQDKRLFFPSVRQEIFTLRKIRIILRLSHIYIRWGTWNSMAIPIRKHLEETSFLIVRRFTYLLLRIYCTCFFMYLCLFSTLFILSFSSLYFVYPVLCLFGSLKTQSLIFIRNENFSLPFNAVPGPGLTHLAVQLYC